MDENCIFCKIVNNEIPGAKIYEDELFIAILDKFPSSLGHCLIVPKKHIEDIYNLDYDTASKLYPLAKKISLAIKEILNCDGINILQNNGTAAGQTVFHFHLHIIPRFKDDTLKFGWTTTTHSDEDFVTLTAKIQSQIK